MNFKESYQYLLSLGNEVSAMKLGLESMTLLLRALGDPQKNYLKVQVAGTNGKGSVCAFVEAMCVAAGLKVGVTTSPHLISVTERVRVNGKPIGETEFADLTTRVRTTAEDLVKLGELETVPTYFEQVTAVALLAFAESEVKLAVLETGLGGRLDATTAANAEVAVITRIDLDHQQYLGDTIEEIAAEKAAIISDGTSYAVIGRQADEALKVILDRCHTFNVTTSNELFTPWTVTAVDADHVRVDATGYVFPNVSIGLKGQHQIENAETAIKIMQYLYYGCGLSFEEADLVTGLQSARHPGRLEFHGRYLFDGAHNVGGAKALRAYLDEFIDRSITMIFGAMKDKDVTEIAQILFPVATTLILTRPNNERSMELEELEAIANKYVDKANIIKTSTVEKALAKARALSGKRKIILITGSLYLVGEAQTLLSKQPKI